MKVNNIQNCNINRYAQRGVAANKKANNSPSFGGALAVNFWDAIARGGFAASFTVQDMTGTNFPRTYQALQRNKEITGENNYKAAAEVAIREFLTGPSMCIIPMVVLAGSKKALGKANEVPLDNIEAFSDQMKGILKNTTIRRTDLEFPKNFPHQYSQGIKKQFYQRMFTLALGDNPENAEKVKETADELAEMLLNYDNAPKRGFFKQLFNKNLVETVNDGSRRPVGSIIDSKDQIFSKMVTKFTDARKQLTDDYSGLMQTDMSGTLKKPGKISSLIKDFSNFGCDVQDVMKKEVTRNGAVTSVNLDYESFMEEFKTRRVGSKFLTNILMVVATALFMYNIPKLYTLHKTNPETDAFRNQDGEVIRANK